MYDALTGKRSFTFMRYVTYIRYKEKALRGGEGVTSGINAALRNLCTIL